jgi:hypothetical protein
MRADISIPNPISEAAEQIARQIGMSLSEFYTAAIASYVATHQNNLTATLDRIYAEEVSSIKPELMNAQIFSLGDEKW